MSAANIEQADKHLRWNGNSLATIRQRWDDVGPQSQVLAACGEHRVPAGLDHAVLEQLRAARSDVQYLLSLIDTAGDS